MTLKEMIKQDLADYYGITKITVERDESKGRPGTVVEIECGNTRHAWFFAAINKMSPEHIVTVMDSYLRKSRT